jgi:nucleoside-diphosphate-sugar epimerase
MRVLVTGAAGMVGRKFIEKIARDGTLAGRSISHLTAHDVVAPATLPDAPFPIDFRSGDLSAAGQAADLVSGRPDMIFHLAAIVSGEAELDFEKGYRINLDGTRDLLEAVRMQDDDYRPRFVFASSIAVFGAPFPDTIPEEFHLTPLTSYGTQKAIGELLLADYSRRGFLDGIGIRLPTIVVRPGAPNKAASGFFSGILREPLAGQEAVLPVSEDVRHWMASPRAAVGFLAHAAEIDLAPLGARRSLSMPGLSVAVGEMIEALRRVAGDAVAARIRREPDPFIMKIVEGWARGFDASRAEALGFRAERSMDEIIRIHIDDELGGRIA